MKRIVWPRCCGKAFCQSLSSQVFSFPARTCHVENSPAWRFWRQRAIIPRLSHCLRCELSRVGQDRYRTVTTIGCWFSQPTRTLFPTLWADHTDYKYNWLSVGCFSGGFHRDKITRDCIEPDLMGLFSTCPGHWTLWTEHGDLDLYNLCHSQNTAI